MGGGWRWRLGGLRSLGIGLVLALLSGGLPAPAEADGGGGGGGGGGDGASFDQSARRDDPDYTAAVTAIKAGDFGTAIQLLEGVVARDGASADAYNWLAYAVRRRGDPGRAIPLYRKALAIDPRHRGAHEYIGEAYLALDDLGKAKEHLARLDSLCWWPCSEYRDLKRAVEVYEGSGGRVKPGR